jgi:FlaG/FlaF family flagellin (archaellin)
MEVTSTRAMVTAPMATGTMEDSEEKTPMATSTMEDSEETTPMAIIMVITMGTMDITMGEMDIAVSTQMSRRISPTSPATSARRMGTIPTTAQRISQMMQPSPIHSRRGK